MQKSKQKVGYLSAFFLMVIFLLRISPAFAETGETNAPHPQNKLNLSGLYLGFFPCDDCHGIKTTLALNKSGTYVFITQYVGKSEREFVEKGKYALNETGNRIVLKPKKGSTTEQHYLIDNDKLIKLDDNGERITADGADRYILHRKDVINTPESHSAH